MSLSKLSLGGNNDVIYEIFPPRESLVNDIPAGDGNIEKPFYGAPILQEERVKIRNDSNLYIPPEMLYQTDNNPLTALPRKIGEL